MVKSRNILILALIMALITTFLFSKYLKDLDDKNKKSEKKISVVTAKGPVQKNQKVTKEMLQVKEIFEEAVHPEAAKKIEEIEGKVSLVDIKDGEILFASRFVTQFEEGKLLTRKIREGFRALSVEVNFVESVSNLINPEDYVDVVFTEEIATGGTSKIVNTGFVLENIRVLAVGKRLVENTVQANSGDQSMANTNESEYVSVTLELSPPDAVKLINVDAKGQIKLLLRSKISQ
jgi:pilus assembly protein CpaB